MNNFALKDGELYAENIALSNIAAAHQTPCYVYSKKAITQAFNGFKAGLTSTDHLICFAVKANPNIAILNVLAKLGAGFDIVSGGELARVVAAGGDTNKVVFSGVGKTKAEIKTALKANIACFNVESAAELIRINQVAGQLGKLAAISLRVNPNVDAKTHPHISTGLKDNKFGIAFEDALTVYKKAAQMPHVVIRGVDCHIGSQITQIAPFEDALNRILYLIGQLEANHINIQHVDVGGGVGITYDNEVPPTFIDYTNAVTKKLKNKPVKILFEPGRALVGNAGVLLTKVEYLKHAENKNFAIVDAAMNDLMRPALYDAYHHIELVKARDGNGRRYEIVGPVCETSDFLGRDRDLNLKQDDILAIKSAGAYGASMASNYNSRPRAAEIMVDNDKAYVIRQREAISDLFAKECILKEG